MSKPENHLKNETSPYLLQHADNPVNWYPWSQDALDIAKKENKPILLSVGYSACHWCHVMAHESFEDPATAEIMNQYFINIKVDREERPDLDKIYQTAHSLLTSRSGGWPLTVFLSPDQQMPFFAGTYFPDERRHNMPSFQEICHMVADAYKNKQSEITQQNLSIEKVLKNISTHEPSIATMNSLPLDLARKQLESAFDVANGGFSAAPKFPHADMLERCIRHYLFLKKRNKDDKKALQMALFSMDKMALGGFQDQLGGGFFRYSTDEHWMIPHFEKMLYDNAQLLHLYAISYTATQSALYKQTTTLAANWVMREMQSPEGGYYSALDADTDKEEGKTYVWSPQQINSIVNENEFNILRHKFNLDQPANFEGDWHLHSNISNQDLAEKIQLTVSDIETQLASATNKLLAERNTRNQPGRDDKILCAWNALMIRGMCQAGRRTNSVAFIDSAKQSAQFIKSTLWKEQRLLASYKDGKAHLNAYLDDYAYLLQALIELLQCDWNSDTYQWARDIADSMLQHFEDKDQGGFYFTSHDHEALLYRSKTFSDDAMPNGNAVAANALLQLGFISGNTDYINAAERTLRCSYDALNEQAISHCSLLHSLELFIETTTVIILRGEKQALQQWQTYVNQDYQPNKLCLAIDSSQELPQELIDKTLQGDICAYVCEGTHCLAPITNFDDFKNTIEGKT